MVRPTDELQSGQVQECVDTCMGCCTVCWETSQCYAQQNHGRTRTHLFDLLLKCAEITRTTASLLRQASEFTGAACELCAQHCEACALQCEKDDDEQLNSCGKACRRCAEACGEMARCCERSG